MNPSPHHPFRLSLAVAALAIGSFWLAALPRVQAQGADAAAGAAAPVELPPGAQDVIKLTQAGLNEDVIAAQVRSAGFIYRLTADQIIALTNAGVSQNVIKALIEPAGAPSAPAAAPVPSAADSNSAPAVSAGAPDNSPAAPPMPPSAPPADPASAQPVSEAPPAAPTAPVSFDYFQNQLSPYGMWIQVPQYGWAWVPSEASGNPFWRPYADAGQWLYTDLGWYWKSSYPWGAVAFHYGRWVRMARYGWAWIPDYTWGPAWVCWRQDEAEGFCGWAPLPPGAQFVAGAGLFFRGHLALDVDFGLGWDDFVFCGYDHLLDPNFRAYLLPRGRAAVIFGHSIVRNNYAIVNGRFAVEGLGRERMEVLTHRVLQPVTVRRLPGREDYGRGYPPPRDPYYRGEVRPGMAEPRARPAVGPYGVPQVEAPRTYVPPSERRAAPPPREAPPPRPENAPPADSDQRKKQDS